MQDNSRQINENGSVTYASVSIVNAQPCDINPPHTIRAISSMEYTIGIISTLRVTFLNVLSKYFSDPVKLDLNLSGSGVCWGFGSGMGYWFWEEVSVRGWLGCLITPLCCLSKYSILFEPAPRSAASCWLVV